MSSNMTPSATSTPTTTKPITKGEIGKLQDLLGAALSKVNPFSSETQDLIENEWDLVKDELLNANVAVLNTILDRKRRSWSEKDGVIYFTVTSDGTTGEQWIAKLEVGGKRVGNYAKQLLRSEKFKPTSGITYNVAVIKGEVFSDNDRYTSNIRAEAKRRKFTTPPAELACLIRQKFPDADIEKMGLLWIVTLHEPIEDFDGHPHLLGAHRLGDYALSTYWDYPGCRWGRGYGLAFLVSQVSA